MEIWKGGTAKETPSTKPASHLTPSFNEGVATLIIVDIAP